MTSNTDDACAIELTDEQIEKRDRLAEDDKMRKDFIESMHADIERLQDQLDSIDPSVFDDPATYYKIERKLERQMEVATISATIENDDYDSDEELVDLIARQHEAAIKAANIDVPDNITDHLSL